MVTTFVPTHGASVPCSSIWSNSAIAAFEMSRHACFRRVTVSVSASSMRSRSATVGLCFSKGVPPVPCLLHDGVDGDAERTTPLVVVSMKLGVRLELEVDRQARRLPSPQRDREVHGAK